MKRRDFFKRLGVAAGVATVAPAVVSRRVDASAGGDEWLLEWLRAHVNECDLDNCPDVIYMGRKVFTEFKRQMDRGSFTATDWTGSVMFKGIPVMEDPDLLSRAVHVPGHPRLPMCLVG